MAGIPFTPHSQDMARDKEKSHLDIILEHPYLVLKGTGPDVDPTMLSGHVRLFLTEATSIKQITLQFKGKAKLSVPASDSVNIQGPSSQIVCNHDWSFLEGDKKHSHTLKAGRHLFPFHLEISGSLPSTLSTSAVGLGYTSVAYKLHAIATRPGFSHNIQAVVPVFILRSSSRDALEYQQTLDIENTWPQKLMYSITLPHKAWAAGDTITAIAKFSPLAKGIYIQSIQSSITEITRISTKDGSHDTIRVVASATHEIIDRKAVEIQVASPNSSAAAGSSSALGAAGPSVYLPRPASPHIGPSSYHHQEGQEEEDLGSSNNDVITHINLSIPPSSAYPLLYSAPDAASPATTPPRSASPTRQHAPSALSTNSVASQPTSPSHPTITPSHGIEPILISHRIAWNIFIHNSDGHVSQLRCSLPIKVLDGVFLDESREFTRESRRLLFRINGLGNVLTRNGEGSEGEDDTGEEEGRHMEADRELPSYPAHVRDRVANMYLSEAVTMRVSSPWVGRIGSAGGSGGSALSTPEVSGQGESDTIRPLVAVVSPSDPVSADRSTPHTQLHSRASRSGRSTPTLQQQQQVDMMSHLPHAPGSEESAPLDWVNSELLLSLSLDSEEALRRIGGVPPSVGGQQQADHPHQHQNQYQHQHQTHGHNQQHRQGRTLRWGSRMGSTAGSRAASPERNSLAFVTTATTHLNDNGPNSLIPEGVYDSPTSITPSTTGPGSGFASPFQNLFKATIKPFTNLAGHHGHRPTQSGSRSTTSLMGLHSTSATGTASGVGAAAAAGGRPSGSSLTWPLSGASPIPSSVPSPAPQNEMNDFTSTSTSPSGSSSSLSSPGLESTSHPEPQDPSSIVFRAFTVVPDYSIASRGFIGGGVPPLSSMRGLPSYEEAEAQRKERETGIQSSLQTPSRLLILDQGQTSIQELQTQNDSPDQVMNDKEMKVMKERGSMSEPDLAVHLESGTQARIQIEAGGFHSMHRVGIIQRLQGGEDGDEDEDEDDKDDAGAAAVIQIRTKKARP